MPEFLSNLLQVRASEFEHTPVRADKQVFLIIQSWCIIKARLSILFYGKKAG